MPNRYIAQTCHCLCEHRAELMNFCPLCAILCFFRSADWGDVNWHWLHLLDTSQVSAGGLARAGSLVTCQRGLADCCSTGNQTLPSFLTSKPTRTLSLLCSILSSPTRPPASDPLTATSSPLLPRILSSFLANNIWTPGVSSKPPSLALLLIDPPRCSLPLHVASTLTIEIEPVLMTGLLW